MAQYNLFNSDDVRVTFFEYGASMAQYNLFNPNKFNSLAYDGAIPLLIKGDHETMVSFYQDVFMRILHKTIYSKRSFVTSQARSARMGITV